MLDYKKGAGSCALRNNSFKLLNKRRGGGKGDRILDQGNWGKSRSGETYLRGEL